MNSRTVLVSPTAPIVPPAGPAPKLPKLSALRWVTERAGTRTWTMTNPGLRARHRRVAALAHAPRHPRVLVGQIILPTMVVCGAAALAGIGISGVFATDFIPAWLITGFLLAIGVAAAALSLATRWRQGLAQKPHVVQLTGDHAAALIEIESSAEEFNRQCRHEGARLSTPELLWNAAHDARSAIAIARTLAVLPPEEDVRVLDRLRVLARDERRVGNVTTLQHMVQSPGRETL
ncbi:MAG: hypothetical protein Q4G46_02995 [Propionibacteriaceae bacterium]|nr:hypothetical protein [Propionibacteriaceae bacterium]